MPRSANVPALRALAVACFAITCIASASHAQTPPRTQPDTVRMQLKWEIAPDKSPVADSIGEISSIAVDRLGNVYASDFSATRIWVFDNSGRSMRAIGRQGKGPGEFTSPTGLGISPSGKLYVRDSERVSVFGFDAETKRLTKYESSYRGPAMADWRSMNASVIDSAGRLYYPSFNRSWKGQTIVGTYYRLSATGERVDSVNVPLFPNAPSSSAWYRTGPGGGRMLKGLSYAAFSARPAWDLTSRGTLLVSDGLTYTIEERDSSGRVLQTYKRANAVDRIPARERAESLTALKQRLDTLTIPLERIEGMPDNVRKRELSTTFPPLMTVYSGDDGRVWVRRWPVGDSQRTVFDVFNTDGRFLTTVTLPRSIALEPQPRLTLESITAVAVDSETGANVLLNFVRK